ncbi:MAG TPA: asparagine synthase (glutamine-hydrolyzing) [Acidobacteriaceae bacterium]
MCGIVGMFSRREPVSAVMLERATLSLYHRGPDAQKQWISQDQRVGLGHARLSIIDLATGDQPIASEDGRTRIVVNGEFYGFEKIRRELETRGHRLSTKSDSEIASHLYEDFGVHCLEHLRGEFALVLWDANRRRLFAARDRFGIKPLFYAWHHDQLYLASEVKALFAAGVPARWDEESVYRSLNRSGYQMRTLYGGVFQVPPGYYMLVTDKHVQLNQYWDFNYPATGAMGPQRSDREYAAEFREVLEEAVRLRLRADVPVGVYLSGGLDSCSVIGLTARHHPGQVKAFTLTFEDPAYDEGPIAREMAQKAGAEFHPIPIRQRDLADAFPDAIAQAETTCVNAHGVAKYLLSRSVRNAGYKVVLTGEGSDEILGGYPHFRRDILLYNQEGQDPEVVQRLLAQLKESNTVSNGLLLPDDSRGKVDAVKRVLGFAPSWIEAFSALAARLRPMLAGWFQEKYAYSEGEYNILDDTGMLQQLRGRDPVHQSLYLWAKTMMPTYMLTMLGDRMEMGHSIEGRVPFLDHKLVELIAQQPLNQKIRGMTEKYVLREAVKDLITDTVYKRQKHPFFSPPATLRSNDAFQLFVEDTLRGKTLKEMPFFAQKAVVALLDKLPEMDAGSRTTCDQLLMHMVSLCVLQDRFGLSSGVVHEEEPVSY